LTGLGQSDDPILMVFDHGSGILPLTGGVTEV